MIIIGSPAGIGSERSEGIFHTRHLCVWMVMARL